MEEMELKAAKRKAMVTINRIIKLGDDTICEINKVLVQKQEEEA